VVLVEATDHLLTPFSGSSRRHALESLRARHVEVRLGTTVDEVRPDAVVLSDGEVLPSQTLVWAAGVRASPLAAALDLPTGRGGRVTVAADLSVPGRDRTWAVGDIAEAAGPGGRPLPQLAPVAMQAGRHVARQIRRTLEGRPTQRFRYLDKGTMATIGRRAAVAELPLGIRLSGAPAWLAWLGLHLVTLVGRRNRASVLLGWAWNYLTWDRGPRIVLGADRPRPSVAQVPSLPPPPLSPGSSPSSTSSGRSPG
jgi:NADH:ubiquinone reductase (H+-translocating)